MTDFVSILLLKHAEKAEGVSEVYTFPNFTYTPRIIQSNCLDNHLPSRGEFSSFILVSNTCTKENTITYTTSIKTNSSHKRTRLNRNKNESIIPHELFRLDPKVNVFLFEKRCLNSNAEIINSIVIAINHPL